MVASIGASNPFAASAVSRPFSRDDTSIGEAKPASALDEIQQAGGFYEWQKKVKREKLEAMIREQVTREFAPDGNLSPEDQQALNSKIAEEIARRLREAIEREAKAEAQTGEAKGVIIDIAV